MATPALIDFLNFIEGNIEVFKFRALECCQFVEFVITEIEVLKIKKALLIGKARNILNLVLREVEVDKVL